MEKENLSTEEYKRLSFQLHQLVESLDAQVVDTRQGFFNITPLPQEEVRVIFLPAAVQGAFRLFRDKRIGLYKLCNYGKPAISIKFNLKHQYSNEPVDPEQLAKWIGSLEDRILKLEAELQQLLEDAAEAGATPGEDQVAYFREEIGRLQEQLRFLKQVAADFGGYELLQSSFFKGYCYTMMNYRYYDARGKIQTASSQLLVPRERSLFDGRGEFVRQQPQANIIFLDMAHVSRPVYKSNKEVHEFLEGFEFRLDGGSRDLFIKRKGS